MIDDNEAIGKFLATLEDRIKTQLGYEYNTKERVDEEYEKLTVASFLFMLNYMF